MKGIKSFTGIREHNFIFVGEAGSGKSEIAINYAMFLAEEKDKVVHFFDMDMTKPLFRSRDVCSLLEDKGVQVHFEEQFMDAPTLVGGVNKLLKDENCFVIMDVGGDHIGARSIGGFMAGLNREDTVVYYILNAYRPWSGDIEHIDETLGGILGVSHIRMDRIHLVSNPNLGTATTTEDVVEGCRRMELLVEPYKTVDFVCVKDELYESVREHLNLTCMPIHLYLTYPWAA